MSHSKISKRKEFSFHPNEVAFLGTTCDEIESIFTKVRQRFSSSKLFYLDGDHNGKEGLFDGAIHSEQMMQLRMIGQRTNAQWFSILHEFDLVIVNGNHFKANEHILFCNPEKRGTLLRRKNELTKVSAIVLNDGMTTVPSDIINVLPNQDFTTIHSIEDLARFLEEKYLQIPELNGLVLTGGASSRMGEDKSELRYHGLSQWEFLGKELEKIHIPTFFSVKQKTNALRDEIEDRINGVGPIGGIISAMLTHPNHAHLVVACDMPNVDANVFKELLKHRNHSKSATCFYNPDKQWNEPLCAIWEPKALHDIFDYLALGKTCPRKLLSSLNVERINASDAKWLDNINTPEEKRDWINTIRK